jgi:hypothetical protein
MSANATDPDRDPGPVVPTVEATAAARPRLGPTPPDVRARLAELVAAIASRRTPKYFEILAEISRLAAREERAARAGARVDRPAPTAPRMHRPALAGAGGRKTP